MMTSQEIGKILSTPLVELSRRRTPDFEQLLTVLRNHRPARPVLFEFAPNVSAVMQCGDAGIEWLPDSEPCGAQRNWINAQRWLGYDYATVPTWAYALVRGRRGAPHPKAAGVRTHSLNDNMGICDEVSFESFAWPELDEAECARMAELAAHIPAGMKLVLRSLTSVEEEMIKLVGYENLCLMMYDNPDLVQAVADKVGADLVAYFTMALQHEFIGACVISDDWGFKTQTLLPPSCLRQYVVPWHARAVAAIHAAGRPAILHSCGQIDAVMDDVIDTCKYDGKHSFEDTITPIEAVYERWGPRIAIMGGIDVDFLSRASEREVFNRSRAMLERAATRGGYALGSGNSLPDYVPVRNYVAMNKAALAE